MFKFNTNIIVMAFWTKLKVKVEIIYSFSVELVVTMLKSRFCKTFPRFCKASICLFVYFFILQKLINKLIIN